VIRWLVILGATDDLASEKLLPTLAGHVVFRRPLTASVIVTRVQILSLKLFMPIETAHFLAGGIMPYVLERLLAQPRDTGNKLMRYKMTNTLTIRA
jgi:hypothetical protein